MMRVMPLLTTCLAVLPALATAFQDTRLHEPGVIVRLYDIGVGVHYIPELAPDQLPNVVKVMETIELRTDRGDFAPLADQFLTEVIGNLKIDQPGVHKFRMISDDGSRFWIDGKLVIDHDGLHGPDAKDGRVRLTVGTHRLRILHFESADGEQLELRWKLPRSRRQEDFVLIPGAALSHSGDVSRETSPGTKKIIPPLRRGRPGDGTAVAGVHPSFEFRNCGTGILRTKPWTFAGLPFENLKVLAEPASQAVSSPYVWLPPTPSAVREITVAPFDSTPYAGQFLVAHRERQIHRLFVDQVDRVYQGGFVRFSECGGPIDFKLDDWGGVWTVYGATRYPGNHLLSPRNHVAFEMFAVRAMTNGFEIEFTKPLDSRCGWEADSYYIEQWPFSIEGTEGTEPEAQARVSPPRRDGVRYPVKSASVSPDRKKVFLEIESLKESHVVYIRLLPPCVSEDGDLPWSTEAWYTLNVIPKDRIGKVLPPPPKEPQNLLTEDEKATGWELLFDGKTTTGWRAYKKDHFPDRGWKVTDDCIVRVGPGGGDICTVEQLDNFELKLEWRICAAGNSGIFYRVSEEYGWPWESGPEVQVLDNAEHADGRNPKTSAGSNYALHAPVRDVTEPVGFFNQVRIVADGPHIEHWLNGIKIVEYELESPEWEKLVAESKFRDMPHHGRVKKGHIVLQDHGDKVWYRNIKIRRLGSE